MLGEGFRAGRPLAPCSLVVPLDLGTLDLEKASNSLSELINCTLEVPRGKCWPQQGGGIPRTGIWGSRPGGLASFLGMDLPPSSVGWSACCHDAISMELPGLLHLQAVTQEQAASPGLGGSVKAGLGSDLISQANFRDPMYLLEPPPLIWKAGIIIFVATSWN